MNRTWLLKIVVSSLIVAVSVATHGRSGPSSGGGSGFAVVCRDAGGQIKNAELLDLYEGRTRYHLTYAPPSGLAETDYINGIMNECRLRSVPAVDCDESVKRDEFAQFFRQVHYTLPGERLPTIDDIGESVPVPPGCMLEPLGVWYDDSEQVYIDAEILVHLDSLNQAAFVKHERYYKYARIIDEQTSENTRALVAHIFAAAGAEPVLSGVPYDARICFTAPDGLAPQRHVWHAKNSIFLVYKERETTIVQLYVIMGRSIVTKAIANLGEFSWPAVNSDYRNKARVTSVRKVRVTGSQRDNWVLEFESFADNALKLALYERNVLLEEAYVSYCRKYDGRIVPFE